MSKKNPRRGDHNTRRKIKATHRITYIEVVKKSRAGVSYNSYKPVLTLIR